MVTFTPLPNGQWHLPVIIPLAKHIPSHITVADHRVLVSCDRQTMTCYETVHLYQACLRQRRLQEKAPIFTPTSWADIAARGARYPIGTWGPTGDSTAQRSAGACRPCVWESLNIAPAGSTGGFLVQEEGSSLFHHLQMRKRRNSSWLSALPVMMGQHKWPLHILVEFLRSK